MNSYKALAKFRSLLSENLSGVEVKLGYPQPWEKAIFPFLSIFDIQTTRQQFMSNRFIGSFSDAQGRYTVNTIAELQKNINLQFYAEEGKLESIYNFFDTFTALMNRNFTTLERDDCCLSFLYGTRPFESARAYLNNYSIDEREGSEIQVGLRRGLVDVTLEMNEIIINRQDLITSVDLVNVDISERVIPNASTLQNR